MYILKHFCNYHSVTQENPEGTDCFAHLADARVFKCPYSMSDIVLTIGKDYKDNEYLSIQIYRCPDFRLSKKSAKLFKKNFETIAEENNINPEMAEKFKLKLEEILKEE